MKTLSLALAFTLSAAASSFAQYYYVQPNYGYEAEYYRQQQAAYYRQQQEAYYQQQQAEYYRQQQEAYYRQQQAAYYRQQQEAYDRQQQQAEYYRQRQEENYSRPDRSSRNWPQLPNAQQVDRYKRYAAEATMAYEDPYGYAAWKGQKIARRNFEGANREQTVGGKVLYAGTGISVDDWKKHGWKGGEHSVVRETERGVKKVGKVVRKIFGK